MGTIRLEKNNAINLSKGSGSYGEVAINLNWTRKKPTGLAKFFGGGGGVDLDLGCLYELQNGEKGAVQALGNAFGSLQRAPFIALDGDDRSGDSAGGEWLRINGVEWSQIKRVLIYTFIYEGTPDWAGTDAVVTIHSPNSENVEVRLGTDANSQNFCAIATIENDNGAMKITRQAHYCNGHQEADRRFGWGMSWVAGSK
jgi:tellurite resistance protein TerA